MVFGFQVFQNLLAGHLRLERADQSGIVGRVQEHGLFQAVDRFAGELAGAEEQQRIQRSQRGNGSVDVRLSERENRRHRLDIAVCAANPGCKFPVGDDFAAAEGEAPRLQKFVKGGSVRLRLIGLTHRGDRERIKEGEHLPAAQKELVKRKEQFVAEILRMQSENHVDVFGNFRSGRGNLHHVVIAFEFADDPPRGCPLRIVHHHRRAVEAAHHGQRSENAETDFFRRGHFGDGARKIIFQLRLALRGEERQNSRLSAAAHRDAEINRIAGAEHVERLSGNAV